MKGKKKENLIQVSDGGKHVRGGRKFERKEGTRGRRGEMKNLNM